MYFFCLSTRSFLSARVPDGTTVHQTAINSAVVDVDQQFLGESVAPQGLQKKEALLGLLDQAGVVQAPGQVETH